MNYEICRQPDTLTESIYMLIDCFNDNNPKKISQDFLEKVEGTVEPQIIDSYYAIYTELFTSISSAVELTEPIDKLLFLDRKDCESFAILIRFRDYLEKHPEKFQSVFMSFIGDESETPNDSSQITTDQSLFYLIDESNYDTQTKYDLLYFYYNFDACLSRMDILLEKVAPIIEEKREIYENCIQELMNRVEKGVEEEGVKFFEKIVSNLRLDDQKRYKFYPLLSLPNAMCLLQNVLSDAPIDVYIGTHLFELTAALKQAKKDNKFLDDFLKAISDPTKYKILLLLKDRQCYSKEIADAFQLTGATISHHMNTLVNIRIVTIEQRGNRIYYYLDRDKIGDYLENLRNALLG